MIYCTNCHGYLRRPCPTCHPDPLTIPCPRCGQTSWAEGQGPPDSWRNVLTATLGALLGGVCGGPPGALVGGLIGFFVGSSPGFFRSNASK